ncbi:MAG: hypothetical protein L0191_15970 [Acidobacteria bacterium]|nr:hypothetical protein [Acidobacteriota bacterium]
MRKFVWVLALGIMTGAAAIAMNYGADIKLPKCSMGLCRNANCSPDVLCVKGAHVVNCAQVCSNGG